MNLINLWSTGLAVLLCTSVYCQQKAPLSSYLTTKESDIRTFSFSLVEPALDQGRPW